MSEEKKGKGPTKKELREACKKAFESGTVSDKLEALYRLVDKIDFEESIMYSKHIDKWKAKEWLKDERAKYERKQEEARSGKRARYEDTVNPLD